MAEELATEVIPLETVALGREEARGVMLAAQGLLDPVSPRPGVEDVQAVIERLGVVQIDTINVVRRSQYLVLWSRLGAYDEADFDALLYPRRAIFEYWAHAASILPMSDFPYYLAVMEEARRHLWAGDRHWMDRHPEVVAQTLEAIRDRGPLASADFERPNDGRRAERWDWHGLKESRRALAVLWMLGDLMVHSRRGGQKVYDLREHVLADVFGEEPLAGISIPSPQERVRYFTRRTVQVLGVVVPSWLRNYFSVGYPGYLVAWPEGALGGGNWRAGARALLDELVRSGEAVPATVEGLKEPAYVDPARLPDLERLRAGYIPARTTFLSPFDSLIWDRNRARALFDYEVSLETYVVPEKRRYGYYCLAILHRGQLVGRLDPKMDRDEGVLYVRALYLEPGVKADAAMLDGIAGALRDLARFLDAEAVTVERTQPEKLAERLQRRVAGPIRRSKPKNG
jgi:uncharacterized protein YcaQ